MSDNCTPGGLLGTAPVPPDRLPEPLPPGLNLPIVITIQTDGPRNFEVPVPVRLPNLPEPVSGEKLPPGATTVLWSSNHEAALRDADPYLSTDQRACMDVCMNPNLRIPGIADCDDLSPCAFLELLNEESQFGRHGRHGASDIVAALTPRSWLVEQRLLWRAGQDYFALVFGTRLLGETASAEVPLFRRFLTEFEARSHPDSPAGRRLSAGERAGLLALPDPSNFTSADWTALVDRLDLLAGNELPVVQWDTDDDGLPDAAGLVVGTDPTLVETDGGGLRSCRRHGVRLRPRQWEGNGPDPNGT